MNFNTRYYIFISVLFAFALYIFQADAGAAVPVITCPSDAMAECGASGPANTGTATCVDADGDPVTITFTDGTVVGNCPQRFNRTWFCTDGGQIGAGCFHLIEVNDTIPPDLIIPGDTSIICGESTDPSSTGNATCTDSCPQSNPVVLSFSDDPDACPCPGDITRTWQCTDVCGNASSNVQTITCVPPPIPTLNQWGMIIMAGVLGMFAVIALFLMRRRHTIAGR